MVKVSSPVVLEVLCGKASSSLLCIWETNDRMDLKQMLLLKKTWILSSTGQSRMLYTGLQQVNIWFIYSCRLQRGVERRTSSISKESVFLVRSWDSWSGGREQGAFSGVEVRFFSSSTSLITWVPSSVARLVDWRSPDSGWCSSLLAGPVLLWLGLLGDEMSECCQKEIHFLASVCMF